MFKRLKKDHLKHFLERDTVARIEEVATRLEIVAAEMEMYSKNLKRKENGQ